MSPELIAIIAVGIVLYIETLAMGVILSFLIGRSERRFIQRMDKLEGRMNWWFELLHKDMKQRADKQEARLSGQKQYRP